MKVSIVDKEGNPVDVSYKTQFSAGFDITANENITVVKNKPEATKVHTGMFLKVEGEPEDPSKILELQIRSRSGLAAKGLVVLNSPGTVDLDYKGEIVVLMSSSKSIRVNKGDRIAQGVFSEVIRPESIKIEGIERGAGGLGSTGVSEDIAKPKIETPPIVKRGKK
jgi:dUTP pyrophosphatase